VNPRSGPLARLMRSDFLRHGAIVFASTAIVNVLTYVYNMTMSRRLGVDGYGTLASLVALYNLTVVPAVVVVVTTAKFAAEYNAAGDPERLGALARTALAFAGGITLLLAAGAALGGRAATTYLHIEGIAGLVLVVAGAGGALFLAAVRGILQGVQDYTGLAFSMTLEVTGRLAGGFALAFAGYGVAGAMTGFVLGNALSLVYTQRRAAARCASTRTLARLDYRRIAYASAGVAGSSLATTGFGYADVVLVKHYFDVHTAGLYGVLSVAGKAIGFAVAFIPTILLPKAVDRVHRGRSPRRVLLQAAGATAVLTAAALLVYFFAPAFVLRVLGGPSYAAIAPELFAYGCAASLLAFTFLIATYRIGLHRFGFVLGLLMVLAGEIGAIAYAHRTVAEVVHTLLVGHFVALCTMLYKIDETPALGGAARKGLPSAE